MANKLRYAEHLKKKREMNKLYNKLFNRNVTDNEVRKAIQIDRKQKEEKNKRFSQKIKFWEKNTNNKKDYSKYMTGHVKAENRRMYAAIQDEKINKRMKIMYAIILPIIMFIGIGMAIGTFKSKVIIDGDTVFATTPFDKGIGILDIISQSGDDFKEVIEKGIEYEREVKNELMDEHYPFGMPGKIETIKDFFRAFGVAVASKFPTNTYKIGNWIWFLISQPFKITFRIVRYLMT